jgi:hypothetical protein
VTVGRSADERHGNDPDGGRRRQRDDEPDRTDLAGRWLRLRIGFWFDNQVGFGLGSLDRMPKET